ncbi:MAG: cytochrome c [Deltaproteobacteria bacterium]|nr:cytochrome c [Deltaproteobacteria bacterium]
MIRNIFFLGLILNLWNCKGDPSQTKLQYFPDMADTPGIKTQGNYLDPPEGSVARDAILYPATAEEAESVMENPLRGASNQAEHVAQGKHLFETFCGAACHGLDAKGGGAIVDRFVRPPDLTLDLYKNRKDGFFFHRITFGGAIMPEQGHNTSAVERWQIVLYLRSLQEG